MTHSCARPQANRVHRDAWKGPVVATRPPSHEEIAQLAYAYWETGGRRHGCSEEDWFRAERKLLGRRTS
jgi:hypothetical protein